MKSYLIHRAGPLTALLVCAVAAWILTLIKWNRSSLEILPFAFLALVLALGMVFGRSVGIAGSVIAAVVFAHSMYRPLGSLQIADKDARSGLAWMLLAGVTLSFLLLPGGHGTDHSKHSS